MFKWLLFVDVTVMLLPVLVRSGAVFELDLVHYEARPNECCDGIKNFNFGILKCNECDPYFVICLQPLPSGAKKCVKTSRENNINSQDLADGNIRPNSLSQQVDQWQGSMLLDVDIRDFDSTTADDDIDHIRHTYTGSPDHKPHTIVLTGQRVSITVAITVRCLLNFYGGNCSNHCENTTTTFCDVDGNTVSYTDPLSTILPTISKSDDAPTSKADTAHGKAITSIQSSSMEPSPASSTTSPGIRSTHSARSGSPQYPDRTTQSSDSNKTQPIDTSTYKSPTPITYPTPSRSKHVASLAPPSVMSESTDAVSTSSILRHTSNSVKLSPTTDNTSGDVTRTTYPAPTPRPRTLSLSTLTNSPTTHKVLSIRTTRTTRPTSKNVPPPTKNNDSINKPAAVTQKAFPRSTANTPTRRFKPTTQRKENTPSLTISSVRPVTTSSTDDITGTVETTGHDVTASSVSSAVYDSTAGTTTVPQTTRSTDIDIPEPMILYTNSLMLEGYKPDVKNDVIDVLVTTICNGSKYNQSDLLDVRVVAISYTEILDSGREVTDVAYIVRYNGSVVITEYIGDAVKTSMLDLQLGSKNLKRYQAHEKPWNKTHELFVVAISCLAAMLFVAVLLTVTCHYRRKIRSTRTDKQELVKNPDSKAYDDVHSFENKLYDDSYDIMQTKMPSHIQQSLA